MGHRFGIVWAVILFSLPISADAQVLLEWKFQERDKFYQESVTQTKQVIKISGVMEEEKLETQHTAVTSFTVTDLIPGGGVVLEQRIEANRIKGGEAATVAGPLLAQLQGASFRVTLGPDRKVAKFEGYSELVKRLSGEDLATGRALRDVVNEDAMKSSVEEAFAFLPRQPVRKGESWKRDLVSALGPLGTLKVTHTYRYEGPEKEGEKVLERIAVAAVMEYQPPKEGQPAFGLEIKKGDLKAESAAGVIYFDATAGRLARSEMSFRLKGSLVVAAGDKEYTLDMEQEQKVRVRVTDQPPQVD